MSKKTVTATEQDRIRQGIYIDKKTNERLDEIAEQLGLSRSELARSALRKYIKSFDYEEKGYEVGAVLKDGDKERFVLFD